ncbi:MAG TPA: hypothetical protein VIH90_03445 [Candidatus Saccharimonadales bacterium]
MSELEKYPEYGFWLKVTAVSLGVFVAGCAYMQPEIAIPGLVVGEVGVLKLILDYADYTDKRNDVVTLAIKIVTDEANNGDAA